MFGDHVAAGFVPEAFWRLTPRLYLAQMRGARARARAAQQERLQLAWMTAALVRTRKLPSLDALLAAGRPVDVADLRLRLDALSARLPKLSLAAWRARKGQT
ncbi:hypothetical protein [Oceanicella sp. SM1341]|uniref:hypothetical protein n=1 Tax=Oceanicella sp. SM1341 TaxID=1548889 RepID=UPI000E52BF8E|nr:hypothetical protein [Oceanicella sp. SM1341]